MNRILIRMNRILIRMNQMLRTKSVTLNAVCLNATMWMKSPFIADVKINLISGINPLLSLIAL